MAKLKIKKGDTVQIMTNINRNLYHPVKPREGDKGKTGRVIQVIPDKNLVIVEGVNLKTRHVKVGATDRGTKTGGIETFEAPVHISNVMLVDGKKPVRVGFKNVEKLVEGRKKKVTVRINKKTGEEIK